MQKPNVYTLDAEEIVKKTKETLAKFLSFDFKPYLLKVAVGWCVFLFLVFSLLFTIKLALTWP